MTDVDFFLKLYDKIISKLERGYALGIEEFIIDLQDLDRLDSLIIELPNNNRVEYGKKMEEMDNRYINATRTTTPEVPWANRIRNKDRAFRIPKKFIEPEFMEVLNRQGIH